VKLPSQNPDFMDDNPSIARQKKSQNKHTIDRYTCVNNDTGISCPQIHG